MEVHEKIYSSFDMQLYTEYLMEDEAEKKTGEFIKKYGGTKVLLVYDASVKALGLEKTVVRSLEEAGLAYLEMPDGVVPNPRRSLMEKGVEFAKAEKVDFVLGMGGGSTIDTTKAISLGLEYDGPVWDLFSRKARPVKKAKCGVIPTIAASGSEGSRACVIRDDLGDGRKCGLGGIPFNRPLFVLLNPKLTYTVPPAQTAFGAADAFGHTFERYFMPFECHLADEFALGLMRNVRKYSLIAYKDPTNYEARRELQLCALYGHNDITELGRSGDHGGAHDLANFFDGKYDAPHGMAVAMMLAPWLEFVGDYGNDYEIGKAARFAVEVFGVSADFEDPKAVVAEGARRMRSWLKEMNVPMTFSEAGFDPHSVDMDELLSYLPLDEHGNYGHGKFMTMTKEQVIEAIQKILK